MNVYLVNLVLQVRKLYLAKGPTEVLGNIGSSVSLPCNTTSSNIKPVILVMWFKGDTEDPFYSLDMRSKDRRAEDGGKHWAHQNWRNKATFNYIEVFKTVKFNCMNFCPNDPVCVSCVTFYIGKLLQ